MKPAIQAVLFDLAGTVADFGSRAPVEALRGLFERNALSVPTEVIRRHMGAEKREHIRGILADSAVAPAWRAVHGQPFTEEDVDTLYGEFEPIQREAVNRHRMPIAGFTELAKNLRSNGIALGFNTGYSRPMAQPILDELAARGVEADSVVCATEVARGRPAPDMNLRNLDELDALPARCLVVDDSENGMAAGRRAGLWTVGVGISGNTVGLSPSEWQALPDTEHAALRQRAMLRLKRAGAHFVIDTVAELHACLRQIECRLQQTSSPEAP